MAPSIFSNLPNDLIITIIKMNTIEEQNKKYKALFDEAMKHIVKCKECGWRYIDPQLLHGGQQTPFSMYVRNEDAFRWTTEIYLPNDKFRQVWDSNDNTRVIDESIHDPRNW